MESCLRCGAPASASVAPPAPTPAPAQTHAPAPAAVGAAAGASSSPLGAPAAPVEDRDSCSSCGARLGAGAAWCGRCLEPVRSEADTAESASPAYTPPWATGRDASGPPMPPTIGGVVTGARLPWAEEEARPFVASRWRLFWARVFDNLFMGLVAAMLARSFVPAEMEGAMAVVWFSNRCVAQGLTGKNFGKWLVGVTLLRQKTSQPPGVLLAIVREFAHILDGIPCGLGYLWPLWDPKRQTFADKVVGTVPVQRGR